MISKYRDDGQGRYWDGPPEEEAAYIEQQRLASIPSIISMRQCQLYLYAAGLLDEVEAIVATLSVPAQIEWKTSAEVWRSSPMLGLMQTQFGWTDAQVEQMFIDASLL